MASPGDIRMIVTDVDGVLTDGRIIYTGDRRETKSFNVRDGLGVKIAQKAGIEIAVVTSRSSQAVERRCAELGIETVVQGAGDKMSAVAAIARERNLDLSQICYVGDDLPDLAPMEHCGLSAAPSDASPDVRAAATFKLEAGGGRGALRELVEHLLRERGEWESVLTGFRKSNITISGI